MHLNQGTPSGHMGPGMCSEPKKALQSQAGYLATSIQGLGHLHTSRGVFLPEKCLQNCSGANTPCTKCCAFPLWLCCLLGASLISWLENPIPYKKHSLSTNTLDIPDLKEVIVGTMGQLFNKTCLETLFWLL